MAPNKPPGIRTARRPTVGPQIDPDCSEIGLGAEAWELGPQAGARELGAGAFNIEVTEAIE